MISISKWLSDSFGGKWHYSNYGWYSNDGRHMARVSRGIDEFDNPLPGVEYWLYGDGQPFRVWPRSNYHEHELSLR